MEEAVAVLAGLQDDGIPPAYPVAAVEHGKGAADHNSGVLLRGHENVGGHGGGGCLTVGAGDAQGVFILLHDGPPGLRSLKDGDAVGAGGGDLRVVVMDGGGADEELRPLDVLGYVAHMDGDAQGAQMLHRGTVAHVAALDLKAHAVKDLRQGAHGYAADAGQVDPAAGLDIGLNGKFHLGHGTKLPPEAVFIPTFDFFTEIYYTILVFPAQLLFHDLTISVFHEK